MKKKILYGIVAMMCATIGGVKAYDGLTQNNMSALMVENIEALTADAEGGLDTSYKRYEGDCIVAGSMEAKLTSLGIPFVKIKGSGDLRVNVKLVCGANGDMTCTPYECHQLMDRLLQ